MARIDGLMEEIAVVFEDKTSSISAVYFLKRHFYLFGGALGFVAGLLLRDFVVFLVVGGVASMVVYAYAENYLLKIDHKFFSSPGRSRREIFDRYYAGEIGRRLALRMTEPEQLVENERLTVEQTQALFQRKLSVELDQEFKRSDWHIFVAECLHYQK